MANETAVLRLISSFVISFGVALAPAPVAACGVALALTVDISGSVDEYEYDLQMGGSADALPDGWLRMRWFLKKAAVMVVHWSGQSRQIVVVPWTRVESVENADRLVQLLDDVPRAWRNFSTGIGEALAFTANQFCVVADCERRVIDVSGDGVANAGPAVAPVGFAIGSKGVTINGLVITGAKLNPVPYFEKQVIGGPFAFVEVANSYADYPRAMKRKLLRELTPAYSMLMD